MHIPDHQNLPTKKLAACFNNTVATYKYYWFLSILQSVEQGLSQIPKKDLFARMVANAWYTINYFHLSFGIADQLQRAAENLKALESLTIDEDRQKVYQVLANTSQKTSLSHLQYFNNQVPHWFLSPWLPGMTKAQIYKASQAYTNQCLYALFSDEIVVNPEWMSYLQKNVRVLKDFCYWNLALFLQARNPNVPDIPNKLIKPATRNSLTKQRRDFWDIVLKELGSVDCIYTGTKLTVGNYDVEHFVPHAFVSHDLIWNLLPAEKQFNRIKGSKLPSLQQHFDKFYNLQIQAFDVVRRIKPTNKHLLEYLTIFPNLEELSLFPEKFTREKFKEQLQPIITIASNNGFEFLTMP